MTDLRRLDRQVKDNEAEMRDALATTRTTLTTLPGLGTVLAAKRLDAFSGNNVRHRLNAGGNRALNSVLHIIAVRQIRSSGRGQDCYLRKITEGKIPAEARRALKRRLSNVVYRITKRDQRAQLTAAA
ncbi:hypothetical protein [Streptomyces sp. NBC_01235]|uniref:hypothetical protein n=1 Tax=Streptomyces sp. NBC_01235 TaxID=2903788 RepID=UPI002E0E5A11|nr:hypothetical protein OG289_09080 [Streptomyces sp. NBC_01235]